MAGWSRHLHKNEKLLKKHKKAHKIFHHLVPPLWSEGMFKPSSLVMLVLAKKKGVWTQSKPGFLLV